MRLEFKKERLEQIMALKGLSIYQVAIALGSQVYAETVMNWAEGESYPNSTQVERLAKVLKIPVGFFYFENVQITMDRWLWVEVKIAELPNERIVFKFLSKEVNHA